MKYPSATFAIIIATLTNAQLPTLPQCANNCFTTALGNDGCSGLTDFACHCSKPSLVSQIQPCVAAACSSSDQASVNTAVSAICKSAGVSIDLNTANSISSTIISVISTSTSTSALTTPIPETSSSVTSSIITTETSTTTEPSSSLTSNDGSSTSTSTTTAIDTGYASPIIAIGNATSGLGPFTGGAGSSKFGFGVFGGWVVLGAVLWGL